MSRFIEITDIVNDKIKIVVDNETGFMNATKTLGQFYDCYKAGKDATRKEVGAWPRLKAAKQLIESVKTKCDIEEPLYVLDKDIPDEYKGTYMQPMLYDSFLMWIDSDYAFDVICAIRKFREDTFNTIVREYICAKDVIIGISDAISELTGSTKGYPSGNGTQDMNCNEVEEFLVSEISNVVSMLREQSLLPAESKKLSPAAAPKATASKATAPKATAKAKKPTTSSNSKKAAPKATAESKKPMASPDSKSSKTKASNYVCYEYESVSEDGKKCHNLALMAGTRGSVLSAMKKLDNDTEHEWKEVISMYVEDSAALRNGIKNRIADHKAMIVKRANDERTAAVTKLNDALKAEIKEHNKANPEDKRAFKDEKHTVKKMSVKDIPIQATVRGSTYIENEYVSYEEYLDLIRGTDTETKEIINPEPEGDSDVEMEEATDDEGY